jgi:hypothetical protein
MQHRPSTPDTLSPPPEAEHRPSAPVKRLKLKMSPQQRITLRPDFSHVEDQLTLLFAYLKQDAEIYLAPADAPDHPVAVQSLEQAIRYARKWRDNGMYATTGAFAAGTARKIAHLHSVIEIILDSDLKDLLVADGMARDEAEDTIRCLSPERLVKLIDRQRKSISDVLQPLGITPSLFVFTGGGHHSHLVIDPSERHEIWRIRTLHKKLVAHLNELAGFELFDKQVVDSGTRLMRIAGTANCKGPHIRWARIVTKGGPTYSLAELERVLESNGSASAAEPDDNTDPLARTLLKYWQPGRRHELALAVSGFLAKADWAWDRTEHCLRAIAEAAGDEELDSRLRDIRNTYEKLAAGQPVKGYTALAEILTSTDMHQIEQYVMSIDEPLIVPVPHDEVEPFPVEVLSSPMRRVVEQGARAIHCPPDFIAGPLLGLAGTAIGTSRVIEVKPGWVEGPRIYVAAVGEPGSRKSPGLDVAMTPYRRRQRELEHDYEIEQQQFNQELKIYEAACRDWEAKGRPAEEEPEPPPEPSLRQIYTTDTTIEALCGLLHVNPRGMLASRDELTGWARSMNQYRGGKGADRQTWLSIWSGTQVIVNRKHQKEPLILNNPFVGVVGGLPPEVLSDLADERGREDGFIHRILFTYPDPLPGEWTEEGISSAVLDELDSVFARLWDLAPGLDERDVLGPVKLTFTPEGKQVWVNWITAHYAEMAERSFPAHLRGPWAKLEGYCARLALVLHLCRYVSSETTSENIDAPSVMGACALVRYFKSHAKRVYAHLHVTPADKRIVSVITWIQNHGGKASVRDVLRSHVAGVSKASEMRALFSELAERGYGILTMRGAKITGITLTTNTEATTVGHTSPRKATLKSR